MICLRLAFVALLAILFAATSACTVKNNFPDKPFAIAGSETWAFVDSPENKAVRWIERSYDVRALLPTDREAYKYHLDTLMGAIQHLVDTKSWESDGEPDGRIREENGRLIIRQIRDNHVKIAKLLQICAEGCKPLIPGKTPAGWEIVDSPRDHAVHVRLDQLIDPLFAPFDPQFTQNDNSFERVINFLRDRSRQNIVVNWAALQSTGVDREAKIGCDLGGKTLRNAIEKVIYLTSLDDDYHVIRGIGYIVNDGVITISTFEDLHSEKYLEVRGYDIRSLLRISRDVAYDKRDRSRDEHAHGLIGIPPGNTYAERIRPYNRHVDELISVIQANVAFDSWLTTGGTFGQIGEFNGQLLVMQTRENHIAIAQLLKHLANDPRSKNPR